MIPELYTSLNDVRACEVASDKITIATTGGLATLNKEGRVEKLLTALDGLPDGRVLSMNGAWIGTERGAALLKEGKVARVVGTAPVRAILSHGSETYFGTWGKGVETLSGATMSPSLRVSSLAWHDGTLVAGTATGTFRLLNGKLSAFGSTSPTFALATTGDRLFIGGLEGLSSIANGIVRHESDADVRALSADGEAILAATFGKGVLRVASKTTSVNAPSFVSAIGPRCFGTRDGVVVDGKTFASDGLPSPDVAAVAVDGNKIYVGTFDRGLAVIENGKVKRLEGVDPQINALAIDKGVVWIGTARGLYRLDGSVRKFTEVDGLPSADIHALASLNGRVLVGTSKGAAIVGSTIEPLGKKQNVTGDAVWAVASHDGELWLGTNAGLFIGKPGGKFRRLSKLTGELNDDWVTAFAFAPGHAYVGTYAGGVTDLTTSTRLGGGSINADGLRVIDGKLYAATMEGLLVDFKRVTKGVLGNDVTAVMSSPKGMIVATRRGLTVGY